MRDVNIKHFYCMYIFLYILYVYFLAIFFANFHFSFIIFAD